MHLLWVEEVVVQCWLSPDDGRVLVAGRVCVSGGGAGLAAEETAEVGPLLVGAAALHRVALRALGPEDLLATRRVARRGVAERCHGAIDE